MPAASVGGCWGSFLHVCHCVTWLLLRIRTAPGLDQHASSIVRESCASGVPPVCIETSVHTWRWVHAPEGTSSTLLGDVPRGASHWATWSLLQGEALSLLLLCLVERNLKSKLLYHHLIQLFHSAALDKPFALA